MEGQPKNRRRVYSLEPSKIAQAEFAKIYVSHLVPALMKLKEKKSINSEEKNNVNAVKREVGMAMVWSAPPGFAWSNALKAKLQRDHVNVGNDENGPLDFSSNPISCSKSRIHKKKGLGMEDNEEKEEEEGFKRLRRLIPGGEEMGDDEEMVEELESYISCLQMQVNILQCLAETP